MAKMDVQTCLDIFEWFSDTKFAYVAHIVANKADGEQRARHALPDMRKRAKWLLDTYSGTEAAYPFL